MDLNVTAIAGSLILTTLLSAQSNPLFVSPEQEEQRLIHGVRPAYPELARQALIQGTVVLAAFIDESGTVEQLHLVSGNPLLVKAAFDAVKQWRYRPAIRHGAAVPVVTTISVRFTLGIDSAQPDRRGVRV